MKSKGTGAEDRSKALMESRGYQVEKARAKVVWIKGRPISLPYDFWGAYDLICVKEEGFLIIQVKSSSTGRVDAHLAEARKKMLAVRAPPGTRWLHKWEKNEKGRWEVVEEEVKKEA
jgi:hypothetical protein